MRLVEGQKSKMCRVEGLRLLSLSPEQERRRECVRRGRRVVRKYRRISLRREMRRLRELLPTTAKRLSKAEVLEEAVEVIQRLEEQLAERLKEGNTPARLSSHLPRGKTDLESIRKAVGDMMEARAVKR